MPTPIGKIDRIKRYRKERWGRIIRAFVLAILVLWTFGAAPARAQSQSAADAKQQQPNSSSASQPASQNLPDWEIAAGGKQAFDVVSVRQDLAEPSRDTVRSNVPIGPQDAYTPTGGFLSAKNFPLFQYMIFAYKLTPNQVAQVISQLPKWATSSRYDVEGRAAGNPTKDQFRLMMQAVLADRFKLAVHYETKQLPALALVLDKPGKLGPQFRQHVDSEPCSTALGAGSQAPTIACGFPEPCGAVVSLPTKSGRIRIGGRGMPLSMITATFSVPQLAGSDRPVIDKTELSGKYDFVIEFTPQINGPLPPGVNFQPDESGPTFLEALKEQLGLKLVPQNGPVDTIVIDHIEQPSEN